MAMLGKMPRVEVSVQWRFRVFMMDNGYEVKPIIRVDILEKISVFMPFVGFEWPLSKSQKEA